MNVSNLKKLSLCLFSIFISLWILTSVANAQQPPAIPGDANGDGLVNVLDYIQVRDAFGAQGGPSDLNGDAIVNIFDLSRVISHYGEGGSPTPTPSQTPTPTPSPTLTPTPTPPPPSGAGIWISAQEIAALPTSGTAWTNLLNNGANLSVSSPDIDVRDADNTRTLAKALVSVADPTQNCGNFGGNCREQVRATLGAIIGTENNGAQDILAVLRNMGTYVIAADIIDLQNYDSGFDTIFRNWIGEMRTKNVDSSGACYSIKNCQEKRPNNFGTHASASRIAIDLYLNDQADLAAAITVLKGYLGDRASYAGFSYGNLSWQSNPSEPVGINPPGATVVIDGIARNADGVLPDDQRRQADSGHCSPGVYLTWPPCKEGYVWEALQGLVVALEMLHRAGHSSYTWQNSALLRAVNWLHDPDGPELLLTYPWFPAEGDDRWQPWVINKRYGTNFPAPVGTTPGKNMGWTDWTHQ